MWPKPGEVTDGCRFNGVPLGSACGGSMAAFEMYDYPK